MRLTPRLFLATFAMAAATLAWTQAPSPPPTKDAGRNVIDRAIAALGGDNFLHMRNLVVKGRIYGFFHDRISGLELVKAYYGYLPQPSSAGLSIQERELLGKKLDYSYFFSPTAAWDITYRGARQVPDEDWQRYVRTTRNDILYILRCRLNEPGMQIDYIGSDVYLSRHVEIVDITDASDQTVRIYFDHNTLLPFHETYAWFDDKTREHNDSATDFDKYRDAGSGIMWPLVIERERNGYKTYQMFAESVAANQEEPSDIFQLPPGARILKQVQ